MQVWPDTIEGLCQRIRHMIAEREADAMSHRRPSAVDIREADELKKILSQVRKAYVQAVPDWKSE
ncbi:hypothetical protein [Arsenicibacter rosenii]|uniref:Uncharacterized protein n=1 Tax=Arsenicibacter rosenii TaxID=1750698 RepID=A0A1S2VF26_9BACT|nr:hypothetical protein [Arsenicibacter rosenii]OIN56806.1 hypothetical protein BLX24_22795 [Arsenicibacter rosenii]